MVTALDEAVAAFLEHRRRRGLARGTLVLDRVWLGVLISFCRQRRLTDPASLTPPVLGAFLSMLARRKTRGQGRRGRPLAQSTRDAIIGRLRVFLSFLVREGILLVDPSSFLGQMRRPPSNPQDKWVRADELEAMVRTVSLKKKNARRDRALLEILFGCGLRRAEVVALDVDDVDLSAGVVAVRCGKGGRSRHVPIAGQARTAVLAYVQKERPLRMRTANERALFLSEHGRRLGSARVAQVVCEAAARAGRQTPTRPHQLRHGYATELVKRGAGVRVVQRLLGHARIHSTERYTHLDLGDLRAVHRRTHPRERRR